MPSRSSTDQYRDVLLEFQDMCLAKVPFGRGRARCSGEVIDAFAEKLAAASHAAAFEVLDEYMRASIAAWQVTR